jgi:hypothetical protein
VTSFGCLSIESVIKSMMLFLYGRISILLEVVIGRLVVI